MQELSDPDIFEAMSKLFLAIVPAAPLAAQAQIGIEPVGGSPEQAAQFLDAEIAKRAKIINSAGVKAD